MATATASYEVIDALFWQNAKTGKKVSFYGAAPLGPDWEVKKYGYTIRWSDGTIGLTYSAMCDKNLNRADRAAIEAVAAAAAARGFRGWQQD